MNRPGAGFPDAVRALADALRELGLPWIVIGGIAVIARGVARSTVDVDATVWAADRSAEAVLDLLRRHGIVPRITDAAAFEDLVIYKMVAARPRDIEDAEALLTLHGPRVDIARVRRVVHEFAAVLEDQERVAALDRLLRRTGLAT